MTSVGLKFLQVRLNSGVCRGWGVSLDNSFHLVWSNASNSAKPFALHRQENRMNIHTTHKLFHRRRAETEQQNLFSLQKDKLCFLIELFLLFKCGIPFLRERQTNQPDMETKTWKKKKKTSKVKSTARRFIPRAFAVRSKSAFEDCKVKVNHLVVLAKINRF